LGFFGGKFKMKKLMLIVNPVAGRGGFKTLFGEAMLTLAKGGYQPDLYFTQDRGDATAFAADHAAGYDVVACVGGDGTLSEVLAGLMQVKNPPPVGYFPMGTANDVATTLGLPKNDTVGAAKRILSGTPHPLMSAASGIMNTLPTSRPSVLLPR
jgi:diacylglycerol kinase family enzyme